MKVFELHFNPKNKEEKAMASFVREPANVYEKRLGSLYMAAELNQALPQNANFLNNLALAIQKEYYSAGLKKSCQASLEDSLKKANEFLDIEVRKGNVSWLGNLNFAAVLLKDSALSFTKVGDIKIFLIRGNELLEISQNLEIQDINPYPLKIFGSLASGKLSQNDKIVIVNGKNENLLNDLSQVSDEKGLKEFIKTKKQILSETSGICLLLVADQEKEAAKLSFQQTFKLPVLPNPMSKIEKFNVSSGLGKKIVLVLVLASVLFLSFLLFR